MPSQYLRIQIKCTLYKTLVKPIVLYGYEVWLVGWFIPVAPILSIGHP
jgi:hypothetical protein